MAKRRLQKARIRFEEDRKQARANLAKARASLDLARKALALAKAAHAARLAELKAAVDRAKAVAAKAEVTLSFATIRAPLSGVVASVSTQEGETVAAGLSAPTFVTIIDLDRLQVDAFVDEVDIGKIRVGQKALFTVDAYPAEEFAGQVAAIYPKAVIQENVVNYDVVLTVDEQEGCTLRPDMTASVTLFLARREGVLAVPSAALQRKEGETVVTVLDAGVASEVAVKTGWKDGPWIEVLAGLTEGQTVLLPLPLDPDDEEE
jgi:RND family efflux transporter MFP subunit